MIEDMTEEIEEKGTAQMKAARLVFNLCKQNFYILDT